MIDEFSTLLDYVIACGKYDSSDTLFKTYHPRLINTCLIEHKCHDSNIELNNRTISIKYHEELVEQIVKADYYTKAREIPFTKQLLCDSFWVFIHNTLESAKFVSLLQTYSIFEYHTNSQHFTKVHAPPITLGTYANNKKKGSAVYRKISVQSWLTNKTIQTYHNYKMIVSFKELIPFLDSKTMENIKDNHEKKLRYDALINTMCLTQAQKNIEIPNTLNSIVEKNMIMDYIKVVTNKLLNGVFTKEIENSLKPFLFRNVKIILNHGNNQFISLTDLKNDLMIWLNRKKISANTSTIVKIVDWLFVYYYPSLMKYSFYGLTFTNRDDIVFYKHIDAHFFISTKTNHFIKNHFRIHSDCTKLQIGSNSKSKVSHDLLNAYYHCNIKPVLKDLKKINNFRFLSIPDTITTFNSYSRHMSFNMQYVKPANKILTHLRYKVLPDIYESRHPSKKKNILVQNISEIMVHFNKFVHDHSYRTLNKDEDLFYLRFDVKNSYDSVPLDLLHTILTNIFNEIGLDKKLTITKEDYISFSQAVNTSNKRIAEFKPISKLVIDKDYEAQQVKRQKTDGNNDISVSSNIKVIQNISDTGSLTIEDIKEITRKEIFETIATFSNTCYKRTKGLAQGMYLSPILSNIFYDDMIHSTPTLLLPKNGNSFFIRFMDDFLLVSDDYMFLKTMKQKLVKNEMFDKRFEVFVNLEKLELCKKKNEVFEFVGLEFDLENRTVRKKVETSMNVINYSHITTFKDIYNKLIGILEIRLNSDYTMQLETNSIEVIQQQVLHICGNIFTMFIGFLKNVSKEKVNQTEPKHFHKFVSNVINLVYYHINKMNNFKSFNEKQYYRLRQLVASLDSLIALNGILNLKQVSCDKGKKFIAVLQELIHN